jgi:hypothetical protein
MNSENVSNKTENPSLNKGAVMGCAFIALYSRFMNVDYQEADSFDEANSILQSGSNNGDCMPIAIIDGNSNKMVWFEEYIGENECQERVNKFLSKHCT